MQTTPREVKTFTAYVEWDPETQLYVGIVPGIAGAHTQAATLDELQQNLKEVLELCFEEQAVDVPHFVGIQQIEIEI
ncbi:MAG TPA: type II toxin-antitoxin system HicB family antitoxin [Chloroflexota bacterium]|nr:type II toxin-antitoxin system HicB family antitoxin [Chloroflexota bacterium]